MPKNKGKGGRNRRRGKNTNDDEKRELTLKEEGQEYAQVSECQAFIEFGSQVVRMLGNGRLEGQCFDGKRRLCHIRGKMRKKQWVAAGDIILIGLRPFQDSKADVLLKYAPEEARKLKADGELPESIIINESTGEETKIGGDDDMPFDFEEI